MPQLDFNLFFSNFIWLLVNLIFFYIFFLVYILPKLLKVLSIRKFLNNFYTLNQNKVKLINKNLLVQNYKKISKLLNLLNVK